MYIEYFNAIKTLINSNLNSVKKVDYYNNQYTRTDELKAIEYPGVFVEFQNPMNWKTGGNGMQYSETSIILHIVYFDVTDAPITALSLSNDVHKVMQNSTLIDLNSKPLSSSMVRTASELKTEFDQLKVIRLTYDCALFDYSTMPIVMETSPIDLIVQTGN